MQVKCGLPAHCFGLRGSHDCYMTSTAVSPGHATNAKTVFSNLFTWESIFKKLEVFTVQKAVSVLLVALTLLLTAQHKKHWQPLDYNLVNSAQLWSSMDYALESSSLSTSKTEMCLVPPAWTHSSWLWSLVSTKSSQSYLFDLRTFWEGIKTGNCTGISTFAGVLLANLLHRCSWLLHNRMISTEGNNFYIPKSNRTGQVTSPLLIYAVLPSRSMAI